MIPVFKALPNKIRFVVFLISILVFISNCFLFNDYQIDDSFITFRFSENLANGHGLTFTPGEKPVEGYSNFLWLLLLSAMYKIGIPTILSAKLLGLVTTFIAGVIWFVKYHKEKSIFWMIAPLYFIAPLVPFWGTSGLELGLHTLLLTLLFFSLKNEDKRSYLYLILLVLNRPEGIAIALLFTGIFTLDSFLEKKANYSFWIIAVGLIICTGLLLTLFRMQHFGYPLPNTYYAKTHYSEHGYRQLFEMLIYLLPLTVSYLISIFIVIKNKPKNILLVTCVLLVFTQALISSNVSPVMNFMFRYMVPFLPFFIFIAVAVISYFKKPTMQYLAVLSILVSFTVFYPGIMNLIAVNNKIIAAQDDIIKWADNLPRKTTVSMTDLGRIPYFTGLKYNDLWGLLDEEIGQNGFDAKAEFLHQPDYFFLVGYVDSSGLQLRFNRERMIAYNDLFHRCYQLTKAGMPPLAEITNPGYYYLVFQKKPNSEQFFQNLK